MTSPQILAERIKLMATKLNLSVSTVLNDVGIKDKNFINKIESGTNVGYINIVKIADYLDCSVDYLLGRTDEVPLNQGSFIQAGNVSGNIIAGNINGDHNANIHTAIPEDVAELVELIQSLPLVKRAEAVIMLNEMRVRGGAFVNV